MFKVIQGKTMDFQKTIQEMKIEIKDADAFILKTIKDAFIPDIEKHLNELKLDTTVKNWVALQVAIRRAADNWDNQTRERQKLETRLECLNELSNFEFEK